MGFLFSGLFWGIVVILFGLSIIIRAVFNIHFPFFRVLFGLIILFIGLRILVGGPFTGRLSPRTVLFDDVRRTIGVTSDEYRVIFGKAMFDASGPVADTARKVEITTVFGQSLVRISSSIPTVVRVSAAFGGVRLPDGNMISFGDYTYRNSAARNTSPVRTVKINVVFGGAQVEEVASVNREPAPPPPQEDSIPAEKLPGE